MDKVKFSLLVLISFLVILFVNAESDISTIGPFQKLTAINLIQSGGNETSLFDYCNISSVKYPNSSIFISDVQMSKQPGGDFNYTIDSLLTSPIGDYITNGFCGFNSGEKITWAYDFQVTNTGTILKTGESIIYIIFFFASSLMFILFLYGSIVIPWTDIRDDEGNITIVNRLKLFKLSMIVMCYLTLMWTLGLLHSITSNFLILNGAANFFEYFFFLMLYATYPLMVVSGIIFMIVWIQGKNIQKQLQRGLKIR